VSAFLLAPFAEVAPHLEATGYRPVPIKPGFKAPLLDDWQAGHPVEHWLPHRDPGTGKVTDCARWGTGLLTAPTPAVDLDIRDKELVRALIRLADDMIDPAPFRIGSPPKALLLFCTDEPFDKISGRWFALPGEDWRASGYQPHRLEVLGDGQQCLVCARHPRGTFYRWARGEPMTTYRIDLPEIDQNRAQSFLWTAQNVIREVGAAALVRRDKVWFPDAWAQGDFGEPEPTTLRVRKVSGERVDSSWQRLDQETLAKKIDAEHARQLKGGGWITSCPAHRSEGHRSLSITPRDGGGSVVHCFAECDFAEIAREIARIVGEAA
jgi:hypothetical protein